MGGTPRRERRYNAGMSTVRSSGRDAADTRDRILDTAARLFHEHGYHATGVSGILRESGVNSGSLYHFFGSKEDVLRGVIARYQTQLEAGLANCRDSEPDPVLRLFYMLDVMKDRFKAAGCVRGCPIGNLALELSDTHPEVRGLVHAFFDHWRREIASWLREPGAGLRDDVDPDQLAGFILSVVEGALLQARAAGDCEPVEGAMHHLRTHVASLRNGDG